MSGLDFVPEWRRIVLSIRIDKGRIELFAKSREGTLKKYFSDQVFL
jgi:hypothetical protein